MINNILPVDGQLDKSEFIYLEDDEISYRLFTSNPRSVVDVRNKKFFKCKFQKIDFTNINLNDAAFDCCIFENCAIQNYDLSKNGVYNCVFEKCKIVGVKISNSYIKGVTFDNCDGIYNDFSKSKLVDVHIIDTRMTKTSFGQITSKDLTFANADITGSEFFDSDLHEVDFSSTDIHDIQIDLKSLKGLIVSKEQALSLVGFLGIYIKEDMLEK